MKVMLELDVPEEHSSIRLVRRLGRALLEHHHAAAQDIEDVETVLGELCANVTRHAHSQAGSFRVILEHHDSHLVLLVADQGRGFNSSRLPPVGEPREGEDGALRHGGFGLHLVRTLTDRIEINPSQSHGTTVRAEKKLISVGLNSGR